MKKRILIACGAGIATSTIVVDKVEKLLKDKGIEGEIIQCKIAEVASMANTADLIISTTILPTKYDTPALTAMPYITGVGAQKLDQQILDILSK